jgi:hypothetical protein
MRDVAPSIVIVRNFVCWMIWHVMIGKSCIASLGALCREPLVSGKITDYQIRCDFCRGQRGMQIGASVRRASIGSNRRRPR